MIAKFHTWKIIYMEFQSQPASAIMKTKKTRRSAWEMLLILGFYFFCLDIPFDGWFDGKKLHRQRCDNIDLAVAWTPCKLILKPKKGNQTLQSEPEPYVRITVYKLMKSVPMSFQNSSMFDPPAGL